MIKTKIRNAVTGHLKHLNDSLFGERGEGGNIWLMSHAEDEFSCSLNSFISAQTMRMSIYL